MSRKKVILWFRQDLRVHDNEALQDATKYADEVIPVYIFDDRFFKASTPHGFPKTGIHRAQFILDSVRVLRERLRAMGSDLYIRIGRSEDILYELAKEHKTSGIYCNRERIQDAKSIQHSLESKLWTIGQELRFSRGKMLYFTADLPFPVTHTPDHFLQFKKDVEKVIAIRKPLETSNLLHAKNTTILEKGEMPSIEELGYENVVTDQNRIQGGESVGLEMLNSQIDNFDSLSSYLSQGCLSPKQVYNELLKHDKHIESTDLWKGLLMRDYFRLLGKKYGESIFETKGMSDIEIKPLEYKEKIFNRWKDGNTGLPIVDASMRKLKLTGSIPHESREICALYLVLELKQDWRIGAQYFESMLIDYDACSNWGNWNQVSGVGTESKDYPLNYVAWSQRIDPTAKFILQWLPAAEYQSKDALHEKYKVK